MPYRRRYTRRTRRYRRRAGRGTISRLRTAIKRVQRQGSQIVWLHRQLEEIPITGGATGALPMANAVSYKIHRLNACGPVFGTATSDLESNTLRHRRTRLHVRFNVNTEYDFVTYHMVILRLRPAATALYDVANGNLLTANFVPDLHYVRNTTGGNTDVTNYMWNPQYFKVIWQKRYSTVLAMPGGDAVPDLSDNIRGFTWQKTFSFNKPYYFTNPAGNAVALPGTPKVT